MSEAEGSTVFRLAGVARRYRVGTTTIDALRGVDLELPAGELVVLLGASGSGKS
ncbi:MAG: ABC transporter ATP-binding protein, partial [Steroidobacteraceae bacterium]